MVTPTASAGGREAVIDTEEAFTVLTSPARHSVTERVSPFPPLPSNETVPALKPRAGVDVREELDMPVPPSPRQAPPPPWQLKALTSSSSFNPASTVRPLTLPLSSKAPPDEDSAAYLPSEEVLKRDKLEQYRLVCSQITPHVYVGGEDVARSCELLERHGITHVVNCAGPSMENVFPERFSYLKLKLHDSKEEDITWFVYEVIDFVEEARRQNSKARVLLHCLQGVSRSISLAIAYLMWSTPCGFMEAFNEVKHIRPIASPNTGFICCLLEWQRYRAGEVFSSRPIMFRVACHGDHDREKAVVKACRALDGSRGLIEPHTAHLSHKGVFVIQAPSTWPHAGFYVWRGRKASDMALRVALDFVELVQRLEGWAGDVVVVDETLAAPDTTFRNLLGANNNTGEQTGDVVVPMRFHDLLTASAEDRRTTPSPPRRKSPSSPTRAGQASRSSGVGGGREGARAQPLTGFNSEQNALKSVPCQGEGRIACAADGCRKYSLYRLEYGGDVQPNWEYMGLYDEDDLESDGIYLLSTDAEQDCPLYIWIGSQATDSVKYLESACTGGKLLTDAVSTSEWQLPPGRVVHVEREGTESDVFWQVFEIGAM